jgi:hypothetical protein
LLKYIISD